MTEKSKPDAKAAPVPATPVPASSAEGSNPPAEVTKAGEKPGVASKVWMGTAVGVGSAALVAALMYAKRRK